MKTFLIAALCLASCSAFTKFERCKTLSSERCFKTVLQEIKVEVGQDGTDDDVVMEICSDYKVTDCCKTVALKSKTKFFEWSRDSTDRWGPSKFGACKDKEFLVKNALQLTISKQGRDSLLVTNIDLTTKPKNKKLKEIEQFRCGPVGLGTKKSPANKATITCEPAAKFHAIHVARFAIASGKEDGTDDSVSVKICSDANGQCCQKKLSGLFTDDWSKNSIESWDSSYFGNCSDVLYKIKNYPQISVSKTGKDSLKLNNVTLDMDIRDKSWETNPKRLRTVCTDKNVHLNSDCKTRALCNHAFLRCSATILQVDPKTKKTIEPKKRAPSRSGSSSRPGSPSRTGPASNTRSNIRSGGSTTTTTTTTTAKPKGGVLSKIFGRR